jgi:O-acetyl-ADP-ribose deacetylase (regulator of RNase III)
MKELTYVDGDIFLLPDIHIVGHQANCQNTMGSGIAKTVREWYPEAYQADSNAAKMGHNKLGHLSYCNITSKPVPNDLMMIFNLYGQNLFGREARQTNYDALYTALEKMHRYIYEYFNKDSYRHSTTGRYPTVGFPWKMGCDRAGGDWNIVSRLIEVAFDTYPGDVIIVKFKPMPIPQKENALQQFVANP